jgi:hypothetical protein
MYEEILAMSRRKKELWILNRNLKWKICSLVREYRKIRKEIKKITRRSVRALEETIASYKKNPKKIIAYVNRRQSVKSNINAIRDFDGSVKVEKK